MQTKVLISEKKDANGEYIFDAKDSKSEEKLQTMENFLTERAQNKDKVIRDHGAVTADGKKKQLALPDHVKMHYIDNVLSSLQLNP